MFIIYYLRDGRKKDSQAMEERGYNQDVGKKNMV